MTKPLETSAGTLFTQAPTPSRREAIKCLSGAALGIAASTGPVFAQGAAADFSGIAKAAAAKYPAIPKWQTELKQLAPNVYAYIQSIDVAWPAQLANAGMLAGPEHMMAIDAMAWPHHVKAFIAASKKATGKEFGRLLNTHHHGDHVYGNQYFAPAEIVSHEYCREQVLAMKPGFTWPKTEGQADGTEVRLVVPPTVTMRDGLTYRYGNLEARVMFLGPAHTYGDLMVYLPEHKILFAGDIAFHYVTPIAQSGHVTKWIETLDRILAMDVQTIVPGHGPLGGKKELADMREYYVILKREARKRYDAGVSPGRAAAEIDMGKYELWARPERAVTNVVRLYAEFDGSIKPENDPTKQRPATEEFLKLRKMTPQRMPG
jgi:cyclase